MIRLEYAPRSTGVRSVSPVTTRTLAGSTPSSSHTTSASIASAPWPISLVPAKTVTRPERSTLSCTALWGISFG